MGIKGLGNYHNPISQFPELAAQVWVQSSGNQFIFATDVHVEKFIEKRPLLFRGVRFFLNLIKRALRGQLIYLTAFHAYAIGFVFGYLKDTNENKSYSK